MNEKREQQIIENWFIMLNTPENDELDVGIVRDSIADFLIEKYKSKLGITPKATNTKEDKNG